MSRYLAAYRVFLPSRFLEDPIKQGCCCLEAARLHQLVAAALLVLAAYQEPGLGFDAVASLRSSFLITTDHYSVPYVPLGRFCLLTSQYESVNDSLS